MTSETRGTITLADFYALFCTRPTESSTTTVYVFDDDASADSWIEDVYFGGNNRDWNLLFTLKSDMLAYYLKEEFCNAKVYSFCAVEANSLVIVIER